MGYLRMASGDYAVSFHDPMSQEQAVTVLGFCALAVVLVFALCGCISTGKTKGDTYPSGWEQMCLEERENARAWFVKKHKRDPIQPPCDVVMVDEPTGKLWGLITYYQPRYLIQIWRDAPRRSTLFHEFKHSLEYRNNKDGSEQAIKRKGKVDSDCTPAGSL